MVREVCTVGAPASTVSKTLQNGSLTFDGKELIVVDPFRKLSLYRVDDLSECVIAENPLLLTAWSDSVTGGIFVRMKTEENKNSLQRNGPSKTYDLVYFASTEKLKSWDSNWTIKVADDLLLGLDNPVLQWVEGANLFALYGTSPRPQVTFIDPTGNEVGKIHVPGPIVGGVDTNDDGLEVFFLSREKESFFMRGIVDTKLEKFQRVEKLWPSTRMRLNPIGTREIRMRGLKQGDVRKFVELVSRPVYWVHPVLPRVVSAI